MAPLAIEIKKRYSIPAGLRLHNIEWTIWQRYADVLPRFHPKKIYVQSQTRKLKHNETSILKHVDVAFAITPEDKKRALELNPDLNVTVTSAGVNTDEWQPASNIKRNPHELIIATTYYWQHNRDALKWFIENVMEQLKKQIPEIKLTLLGKNIPADFYLYKEYGVNPIGYVDKVQPYLNRAGIYISPLFVGGGIRIKILEAMAMELPVMASPVAAEGIDANNDNGLFICRSVGDFISNITSLINDDSKREKGGKSARSFIRNHFSWEKNVNIMIGEYEKIKKSIDD
jgi:glycosyltransferase involved in cell wall biosynthesis